MKVSYLLLVVNLLFSLTLMSQISISATGADPDPFAGLDVNFTDKGLLIPRLSLTSTTSKYPFNSTDNLPTSLLVFNTNTQNDVTPGYYYWDATQSKWIRLANSDHTHANLTFNNSGAGAPSGTVYNGTTAYTISYNTIGAAPSNHTHATLTPGNGLSGSAYDGSTPQTWTVNFGSVSGLANANSNGTSVQVARADHQHKRDVRVASNGIDVGTRNRLNFIAGSNVTLNISDDAGSDEIDITINASGGASNAWLTTGNNGLTDGTHFLGTTDNIPLSFRVNNQKAGRIDHIKYNTIFGYQSGYNLSTNSQYNTFIGHQAGYSNTDGSYNIFIGHHAGYSNTNAQQGVAIGYKALYTNSTSWANVVVGYLAAQNLTGNQNTAIGYYAMNNVSGNAAYNVAVGGYALSCYYTGGTDIQSNVAIGASAIQDGTTAKYNSALGNMALCKVTSGQYNVGIGYMAGHYATKSDYITGSGNILIGYQAAKSITSGSNNIIIGYNVDIPSPTGSYQLNIGNIIYGTGVDGTGTTVSSGKIGIRTSSPTATLHIVSPNLSANQATVRIQPIGGGSSTTSQFSLIDMWSTFDQYSADQGPRRTASIKARYLFYNGSGTWDREILSFHVGGATDAANEPAEQIRITASAYPNHYMTKSWAALSDLRLKKDIKPLHYGLKSILALKPVSYYFYEPQGFEYKPEKLIKARKDFGLIAQDVYEVIPEAVTKPEREDELWFLCYEKLIPVLIKAIQEQQTQIEELKNEIEKLKKNNQ